MKKILLAAAVLCSFAVPSAHATAIIGWQCGNVAVHFEIDENKKPTTITFEIEGVPRFGNDDPKFMWWVDENGSHVSLYGKECEVRTLLDPEPKAIRGSPANTEVVSEKDQQTARSAWAKAVSLAKERNAGHTCEAEAYQSTILSELGVAVKLSPYLQNEVANGTSASAKALRQALVGSLMLSDLIGRMSFFPPSVK